MPHRDPAARKAYQKVYSAAWSKRNRPKKRLLYAKWYIQNRDYAVKKARASHYLRKYGLTMEARAALIKKQKGRCLICDKRRKLVVDHCHDTNRIRGMLCHFCNRWLGIYESWKKSGRFERYLEVTRG